MSKYSTLVKRVSNATAATALTLASLTPAVMLGGSAKAAVLTSRYINMSSSVPGDVNAMWTVNFDNAALPSNISVQVCDSPLADVTCYNPEDTDHDNSPAPVTYTNITKNDDFSATNPNIVGTFYARITSGSDSGSVALSTTEEMTINARVQEQLEFCVGSIEDGESIIANDINGDPDTTISNCNHTTFASAGVVDLGVVDSGAANVTPVAAQPNSGNNKRGIFVIRTNAVEGATIYYTTSGHLRTASGPTTGDSSITNEAFKSVSSVAIPTASPDEMFGMTVASYGQGLDTGAGTSNLDTNPIAGYNSINYSWADADTQTEIANTDGKVSDYEYAILDFAARAAATTPTGSYSTTANFVATATF